MRNRFKIVSLSALLLSFGVLANGFCVGALSEKTVEISKEIIEVSDKAEENIKNIKKQLEDILEEYFAALRLLRVDEPSRTYAIYNGQANNGEKGWCNFQNKTYKNAIKEEIEAVYKQAIDNNTAQKKIYNKNLPVDKK